VNFCIDLPCLLFLFPFLGIVCLTGLLFMYRHNGGCVCLKQRIISQMIQRSAHQQGHVAYVLELWNSCGRHNMLVWQFPCCLTADRLVLQYNTNIWMMLRKRGGVYIKNCTVLMGKLNVWNVQLWNTDLTYLFT